MIETDCDVCEKPCADPAEVGLELGRALNTAATQPSEGEQYGFLQAACQCAALQLAGMCRACAQAAVMGNIGEQLAALERRS